MRISTFAGSGGAATEGPIERTINDKTATPVNNRVRITRPRIRT